MTAVIGITLDLQEAICQVSVMLMDFSYVSRPLKTKNLGSCDGNILATSCWFSALIII